VPTDRPRYDRVGYTIDASSTGNLTGEYGLIDYEGGNTASSIVSDVVHVGDFSWTQSFMAANESNWAVMPSDGFIGFAFSSISVGSADTFVETLMPELDEPCFGIYYPSDPEAEGVTDRVLTIGASREQELSDGVEAAKIPIVGWSGYEVWRSNLMSVTGSVAPGSRSTAPNGTAPGDNDAPAVETKVDFVYTNAVFDTGGGGILLSENKIEDIYRSIGLNRTAILWGEHVMMCDDFNSSWSVTFSFADTTSATEFPVILTGDQLALPGFPAREGACWPPFEPGDFNLLGKLFLRNFYSAGISARRRSRTIARPSGCGGCPRSRSEANNVKAIKISTSELYAGYRGVVNLVRAFEGSADCIADWFARSDGCNHMVHKDQ
jgi:hypothetical protein